MDIFVYVKPSNVGGEEKVSEVALSMDDHHTVHSNY